MQESSVIKRIVLKNFMAHKETVIDLAEGVTVITGPNNVGKSAIVEAVRALAQNPSQSRRAIRHGAKSAVVRVELESGDVLEWERNEKSAIYRIHTPLDGECGDRERLAGDPSERETNTYAKFGHAIPEDVRSRLRLDLVETEGNKNVDIHIGNQRYPIFLLDQAGFQAASFFAASTEAVHLLRMQQTLKSRTDRSKAKRKELLEEALEIEKELARYAALDALALVLEQAEADYGKIIERAKDIPIFGAFIEGMAGMLRRFETKARTASVLTPLAAPVELHAAAPLDQMIIESDAVLIAGERLTLRHALLGSLRQAPTLHDAPALDALLGQMTPSRSRWIRAGQDLGVLNGLSAPPRLMDAPALAAYILAYDSAARLHVELGQRAKALMPLGSPPPFLAVRELEATADAMEKTGLALERAGVAMGAIVRLSAPPVPNETMALQDIADQMERCEARMQERRSACAALAKASPPPAPRDDSALYGLVEQLAVLEGRTEGAEMRRAALTCLAPVPVPHSLESLEEFIRRADALHKEIARMEALREEAERQCALKREAVRKAVEDVGACPLCGRPMDATHFLETAHAGSTATA